MRRLRTIIIGWTCSAMNWNSEFFAPLNLDGEIEWRDHVRWWIEARLVSVFHWAYIGSAEEVRDGVEFAADGVSDDYLTETQLEIGRGERPGPKDA